MRNIKRQGILFTVQFICAAVFLTASIASVGIRTGGAVMAALPDGTEATDNADGPTAVADTKESSTEPAEPQGGSPIVQVDLSLSDGSGDILYKNETDYTFDTWIMLNGGYPIEPVGDEPSVLIIHSHATECYTAEGADTVTDTRSADPKENMLAVGEVLAEGLREHGVSVLHCTEMHDADSYSEAYINSKASVQRYLEEYPSVKYVIDLHRDAISTSEGGMAKPVVSIDGVDYAQLMLVVGTDEGGAHHPGWRANLCVAVRTQAAITEYSYELARPINLRSASFNQQLSPGYLLLEVGSCANTLSEAKASARLFAKIFAELIKNP